MSGTTKRSGLLASSLAAIAAIAAASYPAPCQARQPTQCEINGGLVPIVPPGSPQVVSRVEWRPADSGPSPRYLTPHFEWVTLNTSTSPPIPADPFSPQPESGPLHPPYNSACWATLANDFGEVNYTRAELPPGYPAGFRLGFNLLQPPSPGDFLCPAPTVGLSSICLAPPGAEGASTAWQEVKRPTLGGVVDLITGLPLIQVTDLELPFDGATFRLTRTRSGNHHVAMQGLSAQFDAADRWWDWTGTGWMVGENPILLIDAALADATGDGPRTTWLWLDAHHSIPFQQVYHPGSTPRMEYEAPPRFRARMEHNGTWEGPTQTGQTGVYNKDDPIGRWRYLTPLTPNDPSITIGPLVKQYAYDGLGRLARTLSPYPEPGAAADYTRTERFYYDGIRRIQEVVSNPVASIQYADGSNDPFLVGILNQSGGGDDDPTGTPLAFESGQDDGGLILPILEREYVWGPGGVDELLAQFDAARNPWWAICDEGGDVVALCDTPASSGDGRVVAQYTYDAYGQPVTTEHLAPHPYLHCGHKGLFVDRLDIGVVNAAGYESPRLIPFAQLVAHNRNRVYIPQMGRFLQPDPNATAMALLSDSAHHGRGLDAIAAAFSMDGMYGDGANLYQYLGSNPWMRHDPLGLSWDPFSMPDEYLAEHAGSVAAFMERISSGMKVAAYVGSMIVSMLPFPISSTVADLGAGMLEGGMPPELVKLRKMLGYVQLGALVAVGAKLAYNATKAAVQYIMKYGMLGALKNMWNAVKSVASRVGSWFERKKQVPGACGCFAAGTLVWTISGQVPIELVRTGDFVLTRDETTNVLGFHAVTTQIVTQDAALLEVLIRHGSGRHETLQTTDEHPFFVECHGWVEADRLSPGDNVRSATGTAAVLTIRFTSHRTTVYNLSVDGVHTFQVGPDGVLVHNCTFDAMRHYWGPMYGFRNSPPRAEVILRDTRTGARIRRIVSKEVHHDTPRSQGGTHAIDNLREVWPWQHEAIDAARQQLFPYQMEQVLRYFDGS